MGFKRNATLVLYISWLAPLASPLLTAVCPHAKVKVKAPNQSSSLLPGATHALTTVPCPGSDSTTAVWLQYGQSCADHRHNGTGGSWGQGRTVLYSRGHEDEDGSSNSFSNGDGSANDGAATAAADANMLKGARQEASGLGEDGKGKGTWEDAWLEEESPTVSSRLQDVVEQLQGELKTGATPQVRSSIKLDGLFAELRDEAEHGADGTAIVAGRDSTITTAAAAAGRAPGAESNALASRPPAQRPPSGSFTAASHPEASLEGSHDLESLSDMLDRVQASSKARDLAQAQARSLAMRSGGPIGGNPDHSWVTINNQRDMKTRFKSIREGRVGWAILPLVMKARNAGIPLSTGVYNAAIAAYSGTPKKYEDALRVLNMLRREEDPDVRPDLGSYNAAMWVCSEAGKWRLVLELMAQARQEGIEPDTMSYNHAMKGMAIQKQWVRARKLLKWMVSEGLSPDVRTYNGLVEAAGMGSASPRKHMIEIVHEMEQAGVEPNSYTYTVLLNCLARRRKIFDGFQVMARLVDARVPLLPAGHRAGLSFCNAFGDWRRAMVLMEDMRVARRRPSGAMYLLAVEACAKGGQWERALSLMVERRALDVREAKEANEKNGGRPLRPKKAKAASKAKKQAARLQMQTLEAVLSAVSEAGQYEVALRLVQQMRAAGDVPSKKCYVYTLRAASKWGRWDVIENLMGEMRTLRVGMLDSDSENAPGTRDKSRDGDRVEGHVDGDGRSRVFSLSSDCYAPLVEACAHASMWEKTIEAYHEGYGFGSAAEGPEHVQPVDYQVYECVLRACVEVKDGHTALQVLRRQAAEPEQLQSTSPPPPSSGAFALTAGQAGQGEVSGGPPDRRCWSLAAEALGRAGMVQQGHRVLMGMVNAGIPLRESTKQEVPSLMPLPTAQDGLEFEWHQRKRRRGPRRQQQQGIYPPSPASKPFVTGELDTGGLLPAGAGEIGRDGVEQARKKRLSTVDLPKGVLNGEGCTAAAVAAAALTTKDGEKAPGMGWLLANDLTSDMERSAWGDGLLALERKRHRMREFSRRRKEQQEKLERILRKEGADLDRGGAGSDGDGGISERASAGVAEGAAQIDSRPGGRRGRNEALTLRMRARRSTPGVLRTFSVEMGGAARGTFDKSGRPDRGGGALNKADRRRNGGEGGRARNGGGIAAQEATR